MTRLASIALPVLVLVVVAGCDKKSSDKQRRAASAKVIPMPPPPSISIEDLVPPAPAAADDGAPETVTKTGVLELELAARGDRYTVRNAEFGLVFPSRPTVKANNLVAADGTPVTMASMLVNEGGDELGLTVLPIPKSQAFDVENTIASVRDGGLRSMGATMTSQTDATLAGLAGKKSSAVMTRNGKTVYVTVYVAWDEAHRLLFALHMTTTTASSPKAHLEFMQSLKVAAPT